MARAFEKLRQARTTLWAKRRELVDSALWKDLGKDLKAIVTFQEEVEKG